MSGKLNEPRGEPDQHGKASSSKLRSSSGVGKGRPPVEHQFKKGNKGGGRPKGAKNRSDYQKLLDRRIVIGHDARGRPIRKTYRDTIDLQLMNKAAKGDLAAIKLAKDFEIKFLALGRRTDHGEPTPEDPAEREKKQRLSAQLQGLLFGALNIAAFLKKFGMAEIGNDFVRLTPRGKAFVNQIPHSKSDREIFQIDLRGIPAPEDPDEEDCDLSSPYEDWEE